MVNYTCAFSQSELGKYIWMNNKKNYGDLGGCYPPRPKDSKDNTLLDLDTKNFHKILIIIHLLIVK